MDPSAHLNPASLGGAAPPPPPPPPPSYASATQENPHVHQQAYAYQHHAQVHSYGHTVHHHHAPLSPNRRHDRGEGETFAEPLDPARYKTRLCAPFTAGLPCGFGSRCVFAHGNQELRVAPSTSPQPHGATVVPALQQQQMPPPPSYQEFQHSAGPSSPLHSRPQTPRGTAPGGPLSSGADAILSPTRPVHPRSSLPGSPTSGDPGAYPAATRFRNEPYSPTGFVLQPPTAESQ